MVRRGAWVAPVRSDFGTDELVEASGRCLAVHGDVVLAGAGPRNSQLIECLAIQAADVVGSIGEVIANALDAPIVGDHTAAVTVDQSADKLLGGFFDKGFLPRCKPYWSRVLFAWTVLRKQARPMVRAVRNIGTVILAADDSRMLPGHENIDRFTAAIDDSWVLRSECDPQTPRPSSSRDAAVAEIQPEDIAVGLCRKRGKVMDGAVARRYSGIPVSDAGLAPPLPDRLTRDSGPA